VCLGVLRVGLVLGGREKVRRHPARRAGMPEHSPSGFSALGSRLVSSWGGGAVDTGNLRDGEAFGFAGGKDDKNSPTTNPPTGELRAS